MTFFNRRTLEEYTNSLADYLPGGPLFEAAHQPNTVLRGLLRGLAVEMFRANGYLKAYNDQQIPPDTVKFIEEWESAVGIPDACFPGTGTIEVRQQHVHVKLAATGVQTEQDMIDLAAILGFAITIDSGADVVGFPLEYPVYFLTSKASKFTIIVNVGSGFSEIKGFPLEFSHEFGSSELGFLECVLNQVKPANCCLIMRTV